MGAKEYAIEAYRARIRAMGSKGETRRMYLAAADMWVSMARHAFKEEREEDLGGGTTPGQDVGGSASSRETVGVSASSHPGVGAGVVRTYNTVTCEWE